MLPYKKFAYLEHFPDGTTKDITAEIPFQIPENWRWCRLGEIGEIIGGGTPQTSVEKYWNGDVSWITPSDLSNYSDKYITKGKRNISLLGLENSSATLISKGSILFSTRAPIGYVAIANEDLTTNQGFKSLSPFIKISEDFIYYFLLSERERIKLFASGTTFQELSATAFSKLFFPLPPLQEQHRIVQKIEQLFALIEKIESNQETLKVLIKQAKSQVLSDAIAGKLTTQNPDDEPATELLERLGASAYTPYEKKLPNGWAWCRLGDCFEWGSGGTPKSTNEEYYNGKIPWLVIGDLNDSYINGSERTITRLGLENSSAKLVPKGTLLMAMYGSIGKLGIANVELATNQAIAFALENEIEIKFLFYYLLSVRSDLNRLGKGATQLNISQSVIKSYPFPLPPLQEQQRIVQQIETYFSFLEEIERNL